MSSWNVKRAKRTGGKVWRAHIAATYAAPVDERRVSDLCSLTSATDSNTERLQMNSHFFIRHMPDAPSGDPVPTDVELLQTLYNTVELLKARDHQVMPTCPQCDSVRATLLVNWYHRSQDGVALTDRDVEQHGLEWLMVQVLLQYREALRRERIQERDKAARLRNLVMAVQHVVTKYRIGESVYDELTAAVKLSGLESDMPGARERALVDKLEATEKQLNMVLTAACELLDVYQGPRKQYNDLKDAVNYDSNDTRRDPAGAAYAARGCEAPVRTARAAKGESDVKGTD